jgi:hypothetical protein
MRPLLYLLSLKLTALFCSGTIIISEQFNSHPTYFEYDYEIDGHNLNPILFEEFNSSPGYFSIDHENEGGTSTQLETSASNGVLNILTDGLSQDIEIEMSYPISSNDSSTGIVYFTVEASNSAIVTDGGTFIDEDGDSEAINQAVAWFSLSNFNGNVDEIALQNHNGVKRIIYGHGDYIEVNDFDKVYLRISYDFNTKNYKEYYSTNGSHFIELFSNYAYTQNDNFQITLGAESNYIEFKEGDVYFDNFIISDSPTYISPNDLEVTTSNGVLNIKGGSGTGERQAILSLPVSSSMTSTGSLFFTVLANNTTIVPNGGTFTDDDGDVRPFHQAKSGILFSGFVGDGGIEMTNDNGTKSISYSDENSTDPDEDAYLDVSAFEKIYLRCSYNFNTGIASKSYSTDGITFIQLSSEYAPNNDNFKIEIFAETQNIELEEGDIYFDNFVITDDTNYDSSLTDDPYSSSDDIFDTDGDGVTDSDDPFPNQPLELELLGPSDFQPKDNVGWIEVSYAYMNGDTFMPGIWHPIDTNLGAWFPFDDSWPSYTEEWPNAWPYYWSSEQQTSTNSVGGVGDWSHYKTSNPYIYTCKFNWTNGTYGFGFSYDGRIDLDNDGNQDGIQIRSGLTFPAEGSQIDFHQIINSLSENLALFTLPSSFTENDFDGDGRNNDIDIDDDNDGIADSYDQFPLVYDVSNNVPTSLLGYIEIYFSDYAPAPSYGIWLPTSETNAINIWNYGHDESRWEGNYLKNRFLVSTDDQYGGTFRINLKDKTNDLFFMFNYVWQSDDSTPDDSGKGFFYNGRIDLDNNCMADVEQITNGITFPATDSEINLANIYDSAESNFIPIQVLDYGQNEYNSVVAQRDAKLTLAEVADLRPGSTMIEVKDGYATLRIELQESSDFETWDPVDYYYTHYHLEHEEDEGHGDEHEEHDELEEETLIIIPADTDNKFFRFKMAE